MKRILSLLLFAFLSIGMLFAVDGNLQKIYGVDDPIIADVTLLYVMSGKSLPSTSGPYSGAELMMMMDKLDRESLSENNRIRYDRVREKLKADSMMGSFSLKGSVNMEGYGHTSTSSFFVGWDAWRHGWENTKPLVSIIGEELLGRNFSGFFDFNLGITKTHNPQNVQIGSTPLWTNIPFLMANDMKQLDFNFPYRAYVSAGGKHWTLQVGRDRLSWGPGRSGNFIIGDHIKYHNQARIAVYDENFKYTFLVLSFPHPQNYYFGGKLEPNGNPDGQSAYLNGISSFIAHRLEWRFFHDRLGLALSEGVMYISKDNRIDLIAISPAHLFHNSYTRSLTNSILGLELDWTPVRNLNIYSQIVVDEMVLPGEPIPGKEGQGKAEPTAMGYMLGATYDVETGGGVLALTLEGALTDPYLYLRDADTQIEGNSSRFQKVGEWGINYVVATREMIGAGGVQYYDEQFLGYKYGGDAIVVDFSTTYHSNRAFTFASDLFYMAHGTHDKWTVWSRVNEGVPNCATPTSRHDTGNHKDENEKERDAVEHTFVFSFNGSSVLPHGFSL